MKRKHRKWYGVVYWEVLSTMNLELEEKFIHNNTKYLYIRINGVGYVMGLGEVGDLKDKLYFLPRSAYLNNKHVQETVVYTTHQMFGAYYHILEHKQTTVQLFSHFIRTYRDYLVG
jgi:hypothetical protein